MSIEILLDELGEKRLLKKVDRMRNLLNVALPDEALYREIMLSLGYSKNKLQFLALATILPYSQIRMLGSQEAVEEALLYRGNLSDSINHLPPDFDLSLRMDKAVWIFRGVRPPNYPQNRIKGIVNLLCMSFDKGLVGFFKDRINENFAVPLNPKEAKKKVLKIMDFKGIGNERKLEMFFNIILPFFMLIFTKENVSNLQKFLYELFSLHPPLSDNYITRESKMLLVKKYGASNINILVNNVKRHFGLLQYYTDYVNNKKEDKYREFEDISK